MSREIKHDRIKHELLDINADDDSLSGDQTTMIKRVIIWLVSLTKPKEKRNVMDIKTALLKYLSLLYSFCDL